MYEPRQKVFWFSIMSRATIIFLQCIFNNLIPDHDADAFRGPRNSSEKITNYDRAVDVALGGLTRWDAQYFVHIAKYGYTFENSLAFFPLYPMCVRYVAILLRSVLFMLNEHSVITIAAVAINYICFVKSALILYDLSERVLGDAISAYKAAILYCVNPANIFFTAAYSESMFAYLTFYAMSASLNNDRFLYVPLGLSILVRSNGLINIGFPIFAWLKHCFLLILPKIRDEYKSNSLSRALILGLLRTLYSSINILNTIFLSLVPFVLLQIWIYLQFCTDYHREIFIPSHVVLHAVKNDLAMPGDDSLTWCKDEIPLAYAKVQSKYWNVGFMKYYEFKQIPNFVLAIPILYTMLKCIFRYFSDHRDIFYNFLSAACESKERTRKSKQLPKEAFVFVVHGLFLTLTAILFVHIQVSTRLLASASPLLYWYCATLLSHKNDNDELKEYEESNNLYSKWRVFFVSQKTYSSTDKFILSYFLGYSVLGCFMYSNFLPWT